MTRKQAILAHAEALAEEHLKEYFMRQVYSAGFLAAVKLLWECVDALEFYADEGAQAGIALAELDRKIGEGK